MKSPPLISVIMNCYNGEEFLINAIDSVYAQTYKNWEIIFWDNASNDTSADIALSYDQKIQYFKDVTTKPLYQARGLAVQKAKGKYLAFLDCDDWWDPYKLEKQISLFKDLTIGFVYGNYWMENEIKGTKKIISQNIFSSGRILDDLLKRYTIGMLTLMIRRSAYDQLEGGFDPKFNIIGDFDVVVRLAAQWDSDYVDEPIAHYRWHGDNISKTQQQKSCIELEKWYEDIKNHSVISKSKELYNIPIIINYASGIFYMRNNMKKKGFKFLLKVPLLRIEKIKLIVAFLLPKFVLKILTN